MSTVFKDFQEWTAEAGVNGQTHKVNFYDDVTGAQVTVTSASLGATHGDLAGGVLSIAIVGGRAVLTLNASGLTGSTTPRWWTATVNGVAIADGGNIYIVTKVTDTITAPVTLSADYPSSGSVTHLHITGSGTVTGAGHKIDFATLYGRITIDAGVVIDGMGNASTPAIKVQNCFGDAGIDVGAGVIVRNSGQFIDFIGNSNSDSYCTLGACHVESNSLATQDAVLASSLPQISIKRPSNSNYPTTFAAGMVIEVGRIVLDSTANIDVAFAASGTRCGLTLNGTCSWITVHDVYSHCTVPSNLWADVANFETNANTSITFTGPCVFWGGQWIFHAVGGITIPNYVIVGGGYSHSYLDIVGHASLDTIVDGVISMWGHDTLTPVNHVGRFLVRGNGARVKIRRPTYIGKTGDTWGGGALSIFDGEVVAEHKNWLAYRLQIDRGPTVTGDGVVTPCGASETEATTSGSPLRPASNPNRLTDDDYGLDYQCVSVGSDTYQKRLVGQVSGTAGVHDPASVNPTFVGGTGEYDIATAAAAIIAGSKTVSTVWTEIRAFYAPTNGALAGVASDGGDIGAVTVSASAPDLAVTHSGGTGISDGGTYAFGNIETGATTTKQFTLTNTGTATLTLGTITASGSVSISGGDNPSGLTIAASATRTLTVVLATGSPGSLTGAVAIPSDDASTPYDLNFTATVATHTPITVTGTAITQTDGSAIICGVNTHGGGFLAGSTFTGGTIKRNGVSEAATGSVSAHAEITLTPATPFADADVLTFSITSSNLTDGNGDPMANVTDFPVTNLTDTTAPIRRSITASGTTITIAYNEALDTGSVPAAGDFAHSAKTISAVSVVGATVRLTVTVAFAAGASAGTLTYTPGTNKVQDLAGNDAPSFTTQTVTLARALASSMSLALAISLGGE